MLQPFLVGNWNLPTPPVGSCDRSLPFLPPIGCLATLLAFLPRASARRCSRLSGSSAWCSCSWEDSTVMGDPFSGENWTTRARDGAWLDVGNGKAHTATAESGNRI